ncbi:MAG TPA: tripartite tricarboxylate transporter permease, partial [Rhizobiaceae bacterium]|nr:tripartite tricarboxylate transporter permease [Rhizobiaceae bacterium]
ILSGLMGVCLGLLFSLVGEDYQSGTMRWTFDTLYLWAGIPIVPFALGLFALPEIAEFVIKRTTIAGSVGQIKRGWLAGARDVAANWTVVLRSSTLGALLGALPGIGSSIIDWVAYGSAVRAAKDPSNFGAGDIRGVIASEASNNAKEGGALIPTLAFGVPGSAAMAIMLGAFSIHGIIPGPDMLDKNLPVTFTLVFSLVLANVLGAGICFLFARQLAKIALVPVHFLAPVVIAITLLGALQGDKHWADLAVFFGAGLLGLAMRLAGWQRPPIILGFVLGILIERYFSTSYNVYGYAFLQRPLVLLFLALTAWGLLIPTLRRMSNRGAAETSGKFMLEWRPPHLDGQSAFAALFGFAFVIALVSAGAWPEEASRFAVIVASIGLTASIAFIGLRSTGNSSIADTNASDISLHAGEMPERLFRSRLVSYCIWTLAAFPMAYAAGPVAGVAVWTLAYMLAVFKVRMVPALATAGAIYLASHALFDLVLKVKWPVALVSGL